MKFRIYELAVGHFESLSAFYQWLSSFPAVLKNTISLVNTPYQ